MKNVKLVLTAAFFLNFLLTGCSAYTITSYYKEYDKNNLKIQGDGKYKNLAIQLETGQRMAKFRKTFRDEIGDLSCVNCKLFRDKVKQKKCEEFKRRFVTSLEEDYRDLLRPNLQVSPVSGCGDEASKLNRLIVNVQDCRKQLNIGRFKGECKRYFQDYQNCIAKNSKQNRGNEKEFSKNTGKNQVSPVERQTQSSKTNTNATHNRQQGTSNLQIQDSLEGLDSEALSFKRKGKDIEE